MNSCSLSARNLSVKRDHPILEDFTWSIHHGEHWVILGPNGSGKTSLLMTLSAYLPITSGSFEVLGKTYGQSDWRELRKKIGIVSHRLEERILPEEPAWQVVLSGKNAMLNHWGPIERASKNQALEILEQLRCSALANRPWKHLSQGERQRVFIGRALMAEFRLLFLDEPCAGLDPVAREEFLALLNQLTQKTPTSLNLVLITHHVEEITPGFTHVLLMRQGKVIASGPKDTLLQVPLLEQAYGARFHLECHQGRYWARVLDPISTHTT